MSTTANWFRLIAFAGLTAAFGGLLLAGPDPKEPADTDWKAEFDKIYSLKKGELVKVIPRPHAPCRLPYLRSELASTGQVNPDRIAENVKSHEPYTFVFPIDGKNRRGRFLLEGWGRLDENGNDPEYANGIPIDRLIQTLTGMEDYQVRIDPVLVGDMRLYLEYPDFVVRRNAPKGELIAALDKVLLECYKTRFRLDCILEEQVIWVASGKVEVKSFPWRKADQIDIYADAKEIQKKDFDDPKYMGNTEVVDPRGLIKLLSEELQKS